MVDLSDTPAGMIARLNSALARRGQDVTVRRYTAPTGNPRPKTDIGSRAFVRAMNADELIGAITQTSSNVVLSPTGLSVLLPLRTDDKVVIAGRERNVQVVKPIEVDGTLVRINLVVAG